jgi:diaminohydroxyphosphoribosylaminopyrimidine deaminase/5-amino-6-(5-phosphoribosylamino)uracil reductase
MHQDQPAGHDRFMRRALELARTPIYTGGNPRVGAVLVKDGRVLKEGYHRGGGNPHAEAIALEGVDATGATMYVNLEPCSHEGRTPPCAPALADAGVAEVVVAIEDPDDRVAGKGIELLRSRGVSVTTGVLAGEAEALNASYLRHRTTGRPFVTLKLALSLDGRSTAADRTNRWITGDAARAQVHRRRAEMDAVIVGAGTVVADDPALTVRATPTDHQPTRVVVDSSGRTPADARLFSEPGSVLIATTDDASDEVMHGWRAAGAEVVSLPSSEAGVELGALLDFLGTKGWIDVLFEGGATLATSLLAAELVDRLELHYGPIVLGEGGLGLGDVGVKTLSDARRWNVLDATLEGDDVVVIAEKAN